MGDLRGELNSKFPGKFSGGLKCPQCGKPLKDAKYKLCYDCSQASKGGGSYGGGNSTLPSDYLENGYFDQTGNLKERYLARNGDADIIAKGIGTGYPGMTTHQLRRFYSHVRAADNRLRMTGDFPAVYVDLKKLDPFVAEAKGKGKIPDLFYEFISKNVASIKSEKDFTSGFMEHFQAVVAFFTFHYPKK